jgi:hypothetical protein
MVSALVLLCGVSETHIVAHIQRETDVVQPCLVELDALLVFLVRGEGKDHRFRARFAQTLRTFLVTK